MCDYSNLANGRVTVRSDGKPVAITTSTLWEDATSSRVEATLHVRRETYRALSRIREDHSFPTWDMLLRELVRKAYPHQYDL